MNNIEGPQTPNIDGAANRWLRVLLILVLISVIVSLLGLVLYVILPPLKGVILLFIIAALLAYLLEPLVTHLENRGVRRVFSILFLYVIIFLFIN